jgi:hypothetical protein
VTASGTGTIAHAGVVLPRLLADRVGLTGALAGAVARPGFVPVRHRGRALVDAACAMAAGACCMSDVEAWTAQVELFGPTGGASDTTVLRALNELAEALRSTGLPGVGGWPGPPRRYEPGPGRRSWPGTAGCPQCWWPGNR